MRKISPGFENTVEKLESRAKSKKGVVDKYEIIGLILLEKINRKLDLLLGEKEAHNGETSH